MMREILFKARRLDDGKWVEGGYGVNGKDTEYEEHNIIISTLDVKGSGYPFYFNDINVDPATVGQYTEKDDTLKARIFEGDIVSAYLHGDKETRSTVHPITFRNGCFWFGNWNWIEFLDKFRYAEIIGNIHDNPELSEVQNG